MRTILFLCAALVAAAPAQSQDLVAHQGDDIIRLGDAPCEDQNVLGRVPKQYQAEFKQASATVSGQNFAACWRKAGQMAHLVYEDGDQGLLPLTDLQAELSA